MIGILLLCLSVLLFFGIIFKILSEKGDELDKVGTTMIKISGVGCLIIFGLLFLLFIAVFSICLFG